MMQKHKVGVLPIALLCMAAVAIATAATSEPTGKKPQVTVGWHDEFNDLKHWTPMPAPNTPEISKRSPGTLCLKIKPASAGETAPEFYWASAYREAEVDLDRYPIMAVRALYLTKDSWWDAIVQEIQDGRLIGKETKTSSLEEPGLTLFDVPAKTELTGKKRIRIRMNVAGLRTGSLVEYAWIRFVSREDAEVLRKDPDVQQTVLVP